MERREIANPSFIPRIMKRCTNLATSRGETEGSLRNLRGSWLELAVGLVLLEKNIKPFYIKATLIHVPDVVHDLLIYTEEHGPVVLSLKTSMRERYKQINTEGEALKNVYMRAMVHFLTLNSKPAVKRLKRKIVDRDVRGIDAVHRESDFEGFFASLQNLTVIDPPPNIITSGKRIE